MTAVLSQADREQFVAILNGHLGGRYVDWNRHTAKTPMVVPMPEGGSVQFTAEHIHRAGKSGWLIRANGHQIATTGFSP